MRRSDLTTLAGQAIGPALEWALREYDGDELNMTTTRRKNICQPADWWLAFETQATTMGYTLSEWIGLNCQAFLPADVKAGLSERQPANRPKKSTDGC